MLSQPLAFSSTEIEQPPRDGSIVQPGVPRRRLLDYFAFATCPQGMKVRLGGGSYASVWKGINRVTGEEVAMKIIVKENGSGSEPAEANLQHAQILMMVDHKHIIQLKDFFDEEKALCLILELATGGNFVERIWSEGVLTEDQARRYCRQILTALAHCHRRGLVHCDIKSENVLFSSQHADAELKIVDFGLAQLVTSGDKLTDCRGTPEYIAPEVIDMTGFDSAADMWSTGVLLFTWMCGDFPFIAPDLDENQQPLTILQKRDILFQKIREGVYSEKTLQNTSPEAKSFIRCLLNRDPKHRYTAEQCFSHPWILANKVSTAPLAHWLKKLKMPVPARVQDDGASHAFYSILLNSSSLSSSNSDMPLMISDSTSNPFVDEMDVMGRGAASLVSLAYNKNEREQQKAAGMIANYLLRREFVQKLVEGGVLRALCHLSEFPALSVLNFVCLALYRIAQVREYRGTMCSSPQVVKTIMTLGRHKSNLVGRQAARVLCEMLREEEASPTLLELGCLPIIDRLVSSPLTEHHRIALTTYLIVAEHPTCHPFLLSDDVSLVSQLHMLLSREKASQSSIELSFLAAIIFNVLIKVSVDKCGMKVIDQALESVFELSKNSLELIRNPAIKALKALHTRWRDELVLKGNEEVQAWVKQIEENDATARRKSASMGGSGLITPSGSGSKEGTPWTGGSITPSGSGLGAKKERRSSPSLMESVGGKRARSNRTDKKSPGGLEER